MNELALFAGAGGGLLGGKLLGFRTVCYVEHNPYCIAVLKARIHDGYLDDAPIWDDVRTFDGKPWRGMVDVITAGFPCQPFSVAGRQRGEKDERNGWPDTARIIGEARPRFLLLENVPALLANPYFGTILGDLAKSGYCVRWDCISASAISAPHQRDRLWILAYSNNYPRSTEQRKQQDQRPKKFGPSSERNMANTQCERTYCGQIHNKNNHETLSGRAANSFSTSSEAMANASSAGLERWIKSQAARPAFRAAGSPSWWFIEPGMGRVDHGVANWMDRLKAIGNGQVPGVAAAAWRLLNQL